MLTLLPLYVSADPAELSGVPTVPGVPQLM
jgi:hypothetical protein